jgi:hypothetical protein
LSVWICNIQECPVFETKNPNMCEFSWDSYVRSSLLQ